MSPANDKDPRLYVIQMIECIERIRAYAAHGRGVFLADRMAQDAVY